MKFPYGVFIFVIILICSCDGETTNGDITARTLGLNNEINRISSANTSSPSKISKKFGGKADQYKLPLSNILNETNIEKKKYRSLDSRIPEETTENAIDAGEDLTVKIGKVSDDKDQSANLVKNKTIRPFRGSVKTAEQSEAPDLKARLEQQEEIISSFKPKKSLLFQIMNDLTNVNVSLNEIGLVKRKKKLEYYSSFEDSFERSTKSKSKEPFGDFSSDEFSDEFFLPKTNKRGPNTTKRKYYSSEQDDRRRKIGGILFLSNLNSGKKPKKNVDSDSSDFFPSDFSDETNFFIRKPKQSSFYDSSESWDWDDSFEDDSSDNFFGKTGRRKLSLDFNRRFPNLILRSQKSSWANQDSEEYEKRYKGRYSKRRSKSNSWWDSDENRKIDERGLLSKHLSGRFSFSSGESWESDDSDFYDSDFWDSSGVKTKRRMLRRGVDTSESDDFWSDSDDFFLK